MGTSKQHTVEFQAMGTKVEIGVVVAAKEAGLQQTLDEAQALVRWHESRLSRFQACSDVSKVNANSGNWTLVHPDMAQVVALAIEAFEKTRGLFNPCLGQWLERWGYNVSFEHLTTQPSNAQNTALDNAQDNAQHTSQDAAEPLWIPAKCDGCPLEVRTEQNLVKVQRGWQLDLGGIAKGWIVEQAALFLLNKGHSQFVVNAGGDMVCAGSNHTSPWRIGIDDPKDPSRSVITLDVDNLAVATSGTYRRHWQKGSSHLHHLVDPRSGQPASSGITSCTVVHESLIAAEVVAKTALILGVQEGVVFLRENAPQGWVVIDELGRVVHAWNS